MASGEPTTSAIGRPEAAASTCWRRRGGDATMPPMVGTTFRAGPHCPLQRDELELMQQVLDQLVAGGQDEVARVIVQHASNLDLFGELLARYPSPLEEQRLGGRRRGLDTLVEALCGAGRVTFALRAPTQAVVGRALGLAQINFFRMLWHVCGDLADADAVARLREDAARRLRNTVYTQLVEEVLSDLVVDETIDQVVRARAVRTLALLWGHRLTWRVSEFLPLLEATWEARAKVRVVGGTFVGTAEVFQLMMQGGDERFVELLTMRELAEDETLAFREFLFGRSSEELERLTARMARDNLSSLELDSRVDESGRDAGSIFYEFFQARFVQSNARRLAGLPGPKRTAEGYVLLAWLQSTVD